MRSIYTLVLLLIGWHLLSSFEIIDSAFYPSPFKVMINTYQLLIGSDLILHIYSSLKRLVIAGVLSIPCALALAIVTAGHNKIDQMLSPMVALTFPLPKVAIYPLMLLVFGIDESSKIALIAVGIFYIVFINARLGFKRLLGGAAHEVVRIYPLRPQDYLVNFLLKGAQLEILTGIKLALNYGLTLIVVSEATASNNGIGHFIWRSWDQFKVINVYAGVFVLTIIGFVTYYAFDYFIEHQRKKYF